MDNPSSSRCGPPRVIAAAYAASSSRQHGIALSPAPNQHGEQEKESGLRSGFNVGVERSCLKGKRVFRNYPPAVAARAQITVAMNKRLEKGRTVKLGRWEDVRARLDAATANYFVFPMGAAEKGSNPDPKAPKVMRPTSDHTRTGLNAATVMEELRHSLNTYKEVAWLLKQKLSEDNHNQVI